MALVICTGVGVVLLAILSPPREIGVTDGPFQQTHSQGPALSPEPLADISSTGPMTAEQLVAEANDVADRLLEAFPDSPQALTLGGRIYYAFGDENRASRCWEKCLEIDPGFAATWHVKGEAAWEQGDYEKAADYLARAIDADPRLHRKLAFVLADSLMSSGNTEEAIGVLEQAAEDGALSLDSLFLLGHAYLQLGQYQKARDRFNAALVIDPESSKVHFGLATVYARLGEPEESRKHREEYAKLKSQSLEETTRLRASLRGADFADVRPLAGKCYVNAGKIYALHGNVLEAEKHWLRAAAVDPSNPEPRALLGVLYTEQGRQEDAVRVRQGGDFARPQSEGM
jgi:tetratricopeptide (TPR) repeat protein